MLDIDNSQDLSPLTTPGGPTLVFPAAVATDPNGDAGHLFCYPAADSGPPAARVYPFGGTVLPGGTPGTPGFTIQDIVVPGTNITGRPSATWAGSSCSARSPIPGRRPA